MVKHDNDGGGREGLDALAGTALGKLLEMADQRADQEARAGIEALKKVLRLDDDGGIRGGATQTPKWEALSQAEKVELVKKAAGRYPRVRAALEKAELKALAGLLRRGRK